MPRLTRFLSLLLLLWTAGCSQHSDAPPSDGPLPVDAFDGTRALEQVRRFISLGPRDAGTPAAMRAAEYLVSQLQSLGVTAAIEEFEAITPDGPLPFRNVLAVFEGRSPDLIILISHFDTKSGISDDFVGANDGGSSTGLLLELARILSTAAPLHHTVILAFVDGEECRKQYTRQDGLHGSRALAESLVRSHRAARVRAAIVVDMIGDKDLHMTVPANCNHHLVNTLFEVAREEGCEDRLTRGNNNLIDDHLPFHERAMPALPLIDFQYGSAPGRNDYWHTPQDTLDKLSPDSLQTVGRLVIRLVNRLDSEATPSTR